MICPWLGTIIPWSVALRSTPGKNAKRPYEGVLVDLPRGTLVTVLSQHGAWLNVKVTLANKTFAGYVSQELVRFVAQGAEEKPKLASSRGVIVKFPQALLDAKQNRVPSDRDNTTVKL